MLRVYQTDPLTPIHVELSVQEGTDENGEKIKAGVREEDYS